MTFSMLFPAASAARAIRLMAITTALQNIVNQTIPEIEDRIQTNRPKFEIKTSSPLLSLALSNRRDAFMTRDRHDREENKARFTRKELNECSQRLQLRQPSQNIQPFMTSPVVNQPLPTTILIPQANGLPQVHPDTLIIRIQDPPVYSSLNSQNPNQKLILTPTQRENLVVVHPTTPSTPIPLFSPSPVTSTSTPSSLNQDSLWQQIILEALKASIRDRALEEANMKARISKFDDEDAVPSQNLNVSIIRI